MLIIKSDGLVPLVNLLALN